MRPQSILLVAWVLFFSLQPMSSRLARAADVAGGIDLSDNARIAKKHHKVMILYFAASYCSYCEALNTDVIHPMRINRDYQDKVVIKEILLDGFTVIKDFSGEPTTADSLGLKYDIEITPTLLFVDASGNEVSERLEGYQSRDFYWYYLDISINNALGHLNKVAKQEERLLN